MSIKKNTSPDVLTILTEVADIMQNGVIWLNEEGHIVDVNEAYAQQLNYTKADFEPKTIFEVNPSTSFLSWKRFWKKLVAEHQVSYETEQMTSDESIYPVRMRAVLLEMEEEPICMAVVENLMETNRFKDLLDLTTEIAGIGSWELDLVNNEVIFTDETYRLLKISKEENITTESIRKIVEGGLSKEDMLQFSRMMEVAIKNGEAFESEFTYFVDGVYETFHINTQPVWLEDQTIKLYGTVQSLAKISKRTDDMYFTKFCLDHANDMIFWVEQDGTFSYVNEMVCKTLGYNRTELIGESFETIVKKNEQSLDWKNLQEQSREQGSIEEETIFKTKKGKDISVEITTNYLSFRGKEINCSFARNISKRKKRDETIALAKQSLDQSIDMIFWLYSDGTFRYFNDAFVKSVGYSRKEIKEMTIMDFFPSTTLKDFEEGWDQLREGKILRSSDRTLNTKSGKLIPAEITVNLVRVEGREYSATVLRDVTARKKKEDEVKLYIKEVEQLKFDAEEENLKLREEFNIEANFSNIISRDPKYKKVLRQVEQVADTEATVLILGETGTGKELLARAVHMLSSRANKQMVKVNCGSLPENLIESELFGHERGAFTGAHQRKIGKFERADKGTIFLDEIGELPLDLQSQLLRVLQEGEIERVGGTELINVDVRVIAATNRDLEDLVTEGKFREDLYYRLNVFPIYNLPLRERREDIPILVKHFVEKYSKKLNKTILEIPQSGMNQLMAYEFMGNVRELENMVERAVILSKDKVLKIDMALSRSKDKRPVKFLSMEDMQKEHIIEALRRTNGKVSGKNGAAVLLDMNGKTLSSRMKKLDIDKRDYLLK
ncbi:MAG: sigma 54-interacting transcriptional regulator [Saprospiraceae bacterium]